MKIITAVAHIFELGGALHRQCVEGFTWIDALLAQQPDEGGTIIVPIVQMGQLRLREFK